jgi:hypothetical protein
MVTSSPSARSADAYRSGWVTFAGVLFIAVGGFTLIDGIVALVNDEYFAAGQLLFGDLTAWGVWWLIVGSVQVLTGIFILARKFLSAIVGIAIAGINMFSQLLWLGTYPGWAVAAIVVDGLIIWALTVHYDEFV